jgi:hypothetical protein
VLELIDYLKVINQSQHFSSEIDFVQSSSHWCLQAIHKGNMNFVSGKQIGVKTNDNKTILLDDLMEERLLDLSKDCVGVYIPADEILNRTKYEWFAVLSAEEILNSRLNIAKYIKASILDSEDEYYKDTKIRSVVAI